MDELDLHQLAVSYCTVYFKDTKPSPKQYIKTYLKAIESFEKYIDKQYLSTTNDTLNEIKNNITILDNEWSEN